MTFNMFHSLSKIKIYLTTLFLTSFLYRAYPHMFLIPRWIIEEEEFAYSILELIRTGATFRVGYQPVVEQYILYFIYLITHINSTTLSQYANPFIGALTIVPIYYTLRKISTQNEALVATTLWTFNENIIYRSSTFNSTETLGFFFGIVALFFYINGDSNQFKENVKRYVIILLFIILSIFTHVLPATFIIGVISFDIFIRGSVKSKLLIMVSIFIFLLFLYSPLNPNGVMMHSINPSVMLSQFSLSNIFLYSISDLLLGLFIFLGSVILVILTSISILLCRRSSQIMYIYLFGCISLFMASWLVYSAYLIAPTRVIIYFVLPISYFSSLLICKFKQNIIIALTFILIILSVLTSVNGINTMLYINNCMTLDEYVFLENSNTVRSTYNFSEWWTDMPLKSSLLLFSSNLKPTVLPNTFHVNNETKIVINLDSTVSTTISVINSDGSITFKKIPPKYKYIILSPRMEKSAFFFINTKYRTIQVNQPIFDIWKDMSDWKLIEEYKDIKLYKWIDTNIEG
jgi:hypothetical protein